MINAACLGACEGNAPQRNKEKPHPCGPHRGLEGNASRLVDDDVTGEVGVEEATEADAEAAFTEVGAAEAAAVVAAIVVTRC